MDENRNITSPSLQNPIIATSQELNQTSIPKQQTQSYHLYIKFIFFGIIILALGIGSGYYLGIKKTQQAFIIKGCPLESNYCPDGSTSWRTGPDCKFSPCTTTKPTTTPIKATPTPILKPTAKVQNTIPNSVEKCTTDKDCPTNTFCDYSYPGGMGPNGYVSGTPFGSQKCIFRCQSNEDCPSNLCQNYSIVGGDVVLSIKGCKQ